MGASFWLHSKEPAYKHHILFVVHRRFSFVSHTCTYKRLPSLPLFCLILSALELLFCVFFVAGEALWHSLIALSVTAVLR